jgi:hypothetical protein
MTAQFSKLHKTHCPRTRIFALHNAAFTPPTVSKKQVKGEYPHMQPFELPKNRKDRLRKIEIANQPAFEITN